MSGPVLAVDLGVTRVVAAVDGGDPGDRGLDPVDVPAADGAVELAAVYAPSDGSALCVGSPARRRAAADPSRYEPVPRLRVDEDELLLGTRVVGVAEAWGAVLSDVVRRAGPLLRGERPRALVLTHPVGWDPGRLEVLRRAGSGLAHTLHLVPEPVAAAAHARWMRPRGTPPAPLAVLDLGARGAAATVLEPGGPAAADVEPAAHRDAGFGGDDADELLLAHLLAGLAGDTDADRVREVAGGVTLADRRHRQVLLDDVRAARERLSDAEQAPVALPGRVVAAWLSRAELEDVLRPALRDVVGLLADTVAAAGTAPDRLAGVWLTGGGSRMPLLGALVHRELGVPATVAPEPRTVVAHGALVVARDRERGGGTGGATVGGTAPGQLGVLAAAARGAEAGPGAPARARPWADGLAAGGPFPVGPTSGPFPVDPRYPTGPASGPFPVPAPGPARPDAVAAGPSFPGRGRDGGRDGGRDAGRGAPEVPPRDPDDTGEILDDTWDGRWGDDDPGHPLHPDRPVYPGRPGRPASPPPVREPGGWAGPRRGDGWRDDEHPPASRAPSGRRLRRRLATAGAVVALAVALTGLVVALTRGTATSTASPTTGVVDAWGHRFALPAGWVRARGDDAARRVVLRRPEAPRGVDLIAVQSTVLSGDLAADPVRARAQIAEQYERARTAGDPVSGLDLQAEVVGRDAVRYRQQVAPGVRLDWVVLLLGGDQVSVGCRHADDGGARAELPRACEEVLASLDAPDGAGG